MNKKFETNMKQHKLEDSQIDLNSVKIYDKQGDLSKRWQIVFKVWNLDSNSFIRKFDYEINKIDNLEGRYKFAKKRIKSIKKMLAAGYCAGTGVVVPSFTIETAITETFAFKSKVLKTRSKNSIQNVVNQFLNFINNQNRLNDNILNLSKKDFFDFQEFLLNQKLSTRTVNNYIYYIHSLLSEFSERNNDFLEKNPAKIGKLKVLKTVAHRALTEQEKNKILPALKRDENKSLYLFVSLIYYMWIRPSECYQLKISNIDFDRKKMFVPALDAKNSIFKWVSMPDVFLDLLLTYDFNNYPMDYYLFSPVGKNRMFGIKPFARNTYTEMHRKLCDKLELSKEIVPYGWKRSGVEQAAINGMTLFQIQTHGRWESPKMVAVYLENTGINLEEEKGVNLITPL